MTKEYDQFHIDDRRERIVKSGSSKDDTHGIDLNRVNHIERKTLPREALPGILATLAVFLAFGFEASFVQAIPTPINWFATFAAFILFAFTTLKQFTRDHYVVEGGANDRMVVPVKNVNGERFLRRVQKEAPALDDPGYQSQSMDAQQRQIGAVAAVVVLLGMTVVFGGVAYTASDGVTWQNVAAVTEALQDGDESGANDSGNGQGTNMVEDTTPVVACNTGEDMMVTVENGREGNISVRGEVMSTNGGLLSDTTQVALSDGSATVQVENLSNPDVSEGNCAVLNATETSIRNNETADDSAFRVNGSAPGVNLTAD